MESGRRCGFIASEPEEGAGRLARPRGRTLAMKHEEHDTRDDERAADARHDAGDRVLLLDIVDVALRTLRSAAVAETARVRVRREIDIERTTEHGEAHSSDDQRRDRRAGSRRVV